MAIFSGAETILKVGGVFFDFCPFFLKFQEVGGVLRKIGFRDR